MKCYKCGTNNKSDANFCRSCGLDLSYRPVCNECGNILNKKDRFCIHCGLHNPIYMVKQGPNETSSLRNIIRLLVVVFPPSAMIYGIIKRVQKNRAELAILNFFFYPIFWVVDFTSVLLYNELRYWI